MQRFLCTAALALFAIGLSWGQQRTKPMLRVSCTADRTSYTATDNVQLTVSLENLGPSDTYIYKNVEWGWGGIWFRLSDEKGNAIRPKEHSMPPPPPPPVHDKSQLVSLAKGYFYGTHLVLDLSRYQLEPGVYYAEVSYQSNYDAREGFGLPILTARDGTFLSQKVRFDIRQRVSYDER